MATFDVTFRVGPDSIYYKASNLKRESGASLGTVSSAEGKLLDENGSDVTNSTATLSENSDGDFDGTTSSTVTLDKDTWYQAQIKITMQDGTVGTRHSKLRQPAW